MVYSSRQLPGEAAGVLEFWFDGCVVNPIEIKARAEFWFRASREVDLEIARRFEDLVKKAGRSELDHWSESAHGALALAIVLDQFPRNLYRGTPRAFSYDAQAREITLDALARDLTARLHPVEQCFLVMPLEHAEDRELQDQSVAAITRATAAMPLKQRALLDNFLTSAREHWEIVHRFGRFPHRNAILERASTVDEQAYMKENATGFGQFLR